MYFSNIRVNNNAQQSNHLNLNGEKENLTIEDKDVVIIGGGCAGVECASKLVSYGFKNIILLEGKVWSCSFKK